jgi:hypothetical protein
VTTPPSCSDRPKDYYWTGSVREDALFYQKKYERISNIEHFSKHLQRCMQGWSHSKFDSPFVTLCQSSGYGKSKLLCSLGPAGKYHVFYVCFREVGSTGVPSATPTVGHLLKEEWRHIGQFQAFLYSCIKVCLDGNISPDQLHTLLVEAETCRRFWDSVAALSRSTYAAYKANIGDFRDFHHFESNLETLMSRTASRGVLFVFDEARYLLTPGVPNDIRVTGMTSESTAHRICRFTILRTALSFFAPAKRLQYMAILADTTPRIVIELVPLQNWESSRRQCYPPCCVLETLGQVNFTTASFESEAMQMSVNRSRYRFHLSEMVRHSRPMFSMSWELEARMTDKSTVVWASLVSFAAAKLIGPSLSASERFTERRAMCGSVALISSRVAFVPFVDQEMDEELVGSHMATLLSISRDRKQLHVKYVEEPMIGAGACKLWKGAVHGTESVLLWAIQHFCTAVKAGPLSNLRNHGCLGEMLAMLILCRAWDLSIPPVCHVTESKPAADSFSSSTVSDLTATDTTPNKCVSFATPVIGQPVAVTAFLTQLLAGGASASGHPYMVGDMEADLAGSALKDGIVTLLQFVDVPDDVTMPVLMEAVKRRVGLKCVKVKGGADVNLIVPVVYSADDDVGDLDHIKENQVGAIFVQVKNACNTACTLREVAEWTSKLAMYMAGLGGAREGLDADCGDEVATEGETVASEVAVVGGDDCWSAMDTKRQRTEKNTDKPAEVNNECELRSPIVPASNESACMPSGRMLTDRVPYIGVIMAVGSDSIYMQNGEFHRRCLVSGSNPVFGADGLFDTEVLFPMRTCQMLKEIACLALNRTEDEYYAGAEYSVDEILKGQQVRQPVAYAKSTDKFCAK